MKTVLCLAMILQLCMAGDSYALTMTYSSCIQSYRTDLAANKVYVRMNGIYGFVRANNAGGAARTLTVTVENIDPDYVTLSEGTLTARGTNTLTFTLNVSAGGTHTVYINPWYLTNDIYFIAWSDNQDGDSYFKNKLVPKAALINAIFTVSGGDVNKATPPTIGGAGTAGTYPYPNDYMRDFQFLNYLSLIEDYPTPIMEVPGNHDLSRGGWLTKSDARYDSGQVLWRKYLSPTYYSFNAGSAHFSMCNFHYDMPNWTSAWGGNQDMGYFQINAADSAGAKFKTWLTNDLTAAQTADCRILVSHHALSMFIPDYHTKDTLKNLVAAKNVNYMIHGHAHSYSTGTNEAGINYLITGDAQKPNPGFSLVHINGSAVTQQHMYADNLSLSVTHHYPNNGTVTRDSATLVCSGYNLPFMRVKFKMSNSYASYKAKDAATGTAIPAYSHQFADYTVVYVETAINNGATKNIVVEPITPLAPLHAASVMVTNKNEMDNSITLSPNPATGNITLRLPAKDNREYRIVLYDLSGRALRTLKSNNRTVVIQRGSLQPGVYMVKISSGNNNAITKKVVFE